MYRDNDMDIGGDSVNIPSSTGSTSTAIPTLEETGDRPKRCFFQNTGSAEIYFTLTAGAGTATVAIGCLVMRNGGGAVFKTLGRTHINQIASATGSELIVTPLND